VKLLLIDNYDSFTWNLAQLFLCAGAEVTVLRNDAVTVRELVQRPPDLLCLSPGPGTPEDSGICRDLVRSMPHHVPILGVCLGMQAINEALGGTTVRAPVPVHGKTSMITHDGMGVFSNVPSPLRVARYHSLCLGRVAASLRVTSRTSDGVVMAVRHATRPVVGVQFHPESFMTEHGARIAENFLASASSSIPKDVLAA
jgi:anthranilate synthase component II